MSIVQDIAIEDNLNFYLQIFLFSTAIITFFLLLLRPQEAGYGRFSNSKSYLVNDKWAWIVFETPNVVVTFYYFYEYLYNKNQFELEKLVTPALFVLHYIHRTYIFTLFIDPNSTKTPISMPTMMTVLTTVNATAINRSNFYFSYHDKSYFLQPHFVIGFSMFFIGMFINIFHDYYMRYLKSKRKGYFVPTGFLYDFVVCPNYFGEVIEWLGLAIMSCTFSTWIMAIFTFGNLFPRSLGYKKWYQKEFPKEFPQERKALIPYLI